MKTEMTNIQKKDIQIALADYCARYGGQNRASKILEGVSVGTISQMVNGNWENISDDMWRKIASQIGLEADKWIAVETQNYTRLMALLQDDKGVKLGRVLLRFFEDFQPTGEGVFHHRASVDHRLVVFIEYLG